MKKAVFILLTGIIMVSCKPDLSQIGDEFDEETGQLPVKTQDQLVRVLGELETISYSKLDKEYKKSTLSEGDYAYLLQGKTYYLVQGDQMLRYLVDDFRLYEFMVKDDAFANAALHLIDRKDPETSPDQYLLLNPKLPQKLLELMLELEKAGHNPHGFTINSCFRHPAQNIKVGGASRSRHIAGEAIDLQIGDINQDGKVTQADKTIVLDILNHKVIGQSGGIGRYPGTFSVHFDVRGYGARWDSY